MKDAKLFGNDIATLKKLFVFIAEQCEKKAKASGYTYHVENTPSIFELAQNRQKNLVYVTKDKRWNDGFNEQFGIYLHSNVFDFADVESIVNALYHAWCHLVVGTSDKDCHAANFEECVKKTDGILGEKNSHTGYDKATAGQWLIDSFTDEFYNAEDGSAKFSFNFTPCDTTQGKKDSKHKKSATFVYTNPFDSKITVKSKTALEIYAKSPTGVFVAYKLVSNCDGNSPATQAENFKNSELASKNPVPGARQQLLA